MRAHLDDADLAAAAEYERRFRHDVMAHVHAFGDQAPAARAVHPPRRHQRVRHRQRRPDRDARGPPPAARPAASRCSARSARFAEPHAALPCLAYTHFQPAQLTTVGKRATLWMQDLALDVEELCHRLETLRLPRLQGHDRHPGVVPRAVRRRPRQGARARPPRRRAAGLRRGPSPVTGQTYPRKADSAVLDALSGVAQSAAKMAGDLRLLQHEGELLEPFESEQIGSSAMAYKRNPMRAERICGLARFVISLQANGAHTAATQWLERTLDDSANRRLTLPEAFLATDAILVLADQHRRRARGAGGGDPPARRRADAVHGHRALAHARRAAGRRPAGAARGDPAAQPRRRRGREPAARPTTCSTGWPPTPRSRGCRPQRSRPSSIRTATPAGRPQQVEEFLDEYLPPAARARPRRWPPRPEAAEVRV